MTMTLRPRCARFFVRPLLRPGLLLLALATTLPTLAQAPGRAPGETAAARSRAPVTVNFVNADIEAVTRAFAAMIGRQIAVDPRVKGTITVYSEQPISVREAYLTYLSSMRGLGFAMVDNGGLLKVVPEAEAKIQTGTVSVGEVGPRGDQVITQIFTLQHQSPNNLVAVLRPLITANNTINANPGSNSLVITDYADNLRRLAQIVAALDRPSDTDVDLIPLKHAVATELAPLVQRLVATGVVGANPAARAAAGGGGAETVVADPRSNALIVRAPNTARLAAMRAVIAQLDVPGSSGPAGGIWVVRLKNADAVRLATVLRAAFSAGTAGGGGGGVDRRVDRHQRQHGRRQRGQRQQRGQRAVHLAGGRRRGTVDRRLHPGRPGHQLADHQRPRAAVPAGQGDDRAARRAPRAGLHRKHDRRGQRRQRGRLRLPVAGPAGQAAATPT
jgi:type II secretory pathway component GspD/PulD (secretin)